MDISSTCVSPCKDCKDRWINTDTLQRCHSSCEKYAAYKSELEEKRAYFNKERELDKYHRCNKKEWEQRKSNIKGNKRKKNLYKIS